MKSRRAAVCFVLGMIVVQAGCARLGGSLSPFANATYLGAILAVQLALFSLGHFESAFFPLLMGMFLWAGSSLPLHGAGNSLRWLFLGVGALGGFVIWVRKHRRQYFGPFAVVAALCVVSALVSATVSDAPRVALLKVMSLFFLFLYAAAGARVAIAGRESRFIDGLVLTCEMLTYFSALCYFVLRYSVFGNPNSLGAIVSIDLAPILLWAAMSTDSRSLRQRRFFAVLLCCGLLYYANSRASYLGLAVAVLVLALTMRRRRMLVQFAFAIFFLFAVFAVLNPSHVADAISSLTGRVIYKESGTYHGVFGSRSSPWSQTLSVIRRRPWFGSGFGTSDLGDVRMNRDVSSVYTTEGTNREHGNSYLALAEYMGLLGSVPFAILIFMVVRLVVRICLWVRRTGQVRHNCLPLALIAIAGLVHAGFEDWLFAVGSYLCVFFWVSVFLLADLAPDFGRRFSTAPLPLRYAAPAPAMAHALRRSS
jgi:O-antigen ligase